MCRSDWPVRPKSSSMITDCVQTLCQPSYSEDYECHRSCNCNATCSDLLYYYFKYFHNITTDPTNGDSHSPVGEGGGGGLDTSADIISLLSAEIYIPDPIHPSPPSQSVSEGKNFFPFYIYQPIHLSLLTHNPNFLRFKYSHFFSLFIPIQSCRRYFHHNVLSPFTVIRSVK